MYNFFMTGMYWLFFDCRQHSNSLPPLNFHSSESDLPVYVCSQNLSELRKACIQELVAVGTIQDHVGRHIQQRQRRGG
jgi:hypothetical protein